MPGTYDYSSKLTVNMYTIDELKKELSKEIIEQTYKMKDGIMEDMKSIDELNALAVTSSDPAAAAIYMTLAAELQDTLNDSLSIQISERMHNLLSTKEKFTVNGKEYDAIKLTGRGYDEKFMLLCDKNENPLDKEIVDAFSNELNGKYASVCAKRKETDKAFYNKFAHEYKQMKKRVNFPIGYRDNNYLQNSRLTTDDMREVHGVIQSRTNNLRNICKAVINGEKFPNLGSKEEHRSESTISTFAYICEKARNAVELCSGKDVPKGIQLNQNQLNILKEAITKSGSEPDKITGDIFGFYSDADNELALQKIEVGKVDGKGGNVAGLVISCGVDDDIEASSFISKVKNGAELTEQEVNWACRQFDNMAERTGAEIRGMLVNGKPVLPPEMNGKPGSDERAKCVLIASALDGKRISAVPVSEFGMADYNKVPSPVKVVDILESIKSFWEKILEFFGLGREDRIKKSNIIDPEKRASDAEKLQDLKYVPAEMSDKLMAETKVDTKFQEKAAEINEKAKEAIQNGLDINYNNCKEFLKGMYPDADLSENISPACVKVLEDFSYTGEDGKPHQYMGTLGRIPSLANMMYLYGMNKGYTFDEMLTSKTIDRAALGKEFHDKYSIKKLDEFSAEKGLDASSDETRKAYNEYVLGKKQDVIKLSTELFETLKKQEINFPDPGDPEKLIENHVRNSTFMTMVGDFAQIFNGLGDSNWLNPSDENAQEECDRAKAVYEYEYYKFMPIQSAASAYNKYMTYLSTDKNDFQDSSKAVLTDMAARSKCLLEAVSEWTKDKKTLGSIVDDKTLSRNINGVAYACIVEDEHYVSELMGELNERYLQSFGKGFDYIRLDTKNCAISRLGISTSYKDTIDSIDTLTRQSAKKAADILPITDFMPDGFEGNLDEAFGKIYEQEKKKAPVREKLNFSELSENNVKINSKPETSAEKKLETEKSMGSLKKS